MNMELNIKALKNIGDLQHERVVLSVAERCDAGAFLIAKVQKKDGFLTNEVLNTFWIPDVICNPNDLVVIYTKQGADFIKPLREGRRAIFFHLGLQKCIWNDYPQSCCPVLFRIKDYISREQ